MQDFAATGNGKRFLNDVNRIAFALEQLVKVLDRLAGPTGPANVDRTIDGLYLAAMQACHESGLPWTDPRSGQTYPPPLTTKG